MEARRHAHCDALCIPVCRNACKTQPRLNALPRSFLSVHILESLARNLPTHGIAQQEPAMSQSIRPWRHPVVFAAILVVGALRLPHEVEAEPRVLLAASGSDARLPGACAGPDAERPVVGCARRADVAAFDLLDPNTFPLYAATDRTHAPE
jgi:hypothetical protein